MVCAKHKSWNLEHSWSSHFSVISFNVKYWIRWELCIGCPLILILHACSNYAVARGSVILISGIQNVPFLFVLEGNILGRVNSKLEIGSNSKYFTLFYRRNVFSYYDIRKCFNIFFISHKISGYISRNYF